VKSSPALCISPVPAGAAGFTAGVIGQPCGLSRTPGDPDRAHRKRRETAGM